jgi:hypothetical protein
MRRWTLTLFLLLAAGAAIAVAPRLFAAIGVQVPLAAPVTPPPVALVVPDIHLLDTGSTAPEPPAVPAVRPPVRPPVVPTPPPIRPVATPGPALDPDLLIPELDEEPQVDWSKVPPPVAPPPEPFWDDCPNCGLG